jgi:hypothetical protein
VVLCVAQIVFLDISEAVEGLLTVSFTFYSVSVLALTALLSTFQFKYRNMEFWKVFIDCKLLDLLYFYHFNSFVIVVYQFAGVAIFHSYFGSVHSLATGLLVGLWSAFEGRLVFSN